jgi:predicted PurR-regulated permease PerM
MGKLGDFIHGARPVGGKDRPDLPAPGAIMRSSGDEATSRESRAQWHLAARIVLSLAILGAALYMLSNYVRALIWAAVLAIALWPLFQRTVAGRTDRLRREVFPLLFTAVVALVFMAPIAVLGVEAAREAHTVLDYGKQAEQNGIPVPEAVSRLPEKAAKPVTDWWNANLAHAGWAKEFAERIDTASNRELGENAGRGAIHRIVLFGFALLALFFLFRDGDAVSRQCLAASDRLFGERGERIGRQIVASVHGTVNGLVLVGLGEGVLLGVVYAFTGVPHAILFGALTAVAAMIPFAAAIAFLLAALTVFVAGKVVPAIIIVVAGFAVTFTADHFVRPSLIGGTTKLPFIWVLLGILGGVESFGLLGLFAGPAIMAALILLWRELAGEGSAT